ncbi:hypothetical protein INR49_005532 [Caranx melampygus]|nr:hypothetical protein INR49_005532 [Caranx melampygus]
MDRSHLCPFPRQRDRVQALHFRSQAGECLRRDGFRGLGRSARPARHRLTELTGKAEEEGLCRQADGEETN